MTPAIQIISRLNDWGVTIRVEGQNLVVTPKSKVPADLIAELPQLKPDLMDLLGKMCFCQPPMPPTDIEAPSCQHCVFLAGAPPVAAVAGAPFRPDGSLASSRNTNEGDSERGFGDGERQ
jgi:hypothetical protein